MEEPRPYFLSHLAENVAVVVGVVLVWRGIWYLLDMVDASLFGGKHLVTALGGVILGLLILYLPDKDLKELGKH